METELHVEWFISAVLYALQYKSWNMNCGTWLSASVVRFAKDGIMFIWQYTSSEVLQELYVDVSVRKRERFFVVYVLYNFNPFTVVESIMCDFNEG